MKPEELEELGFVPNRFLVATDKPNGWIKIIDGVAFNLDEEEYNYEMYTSFGSTILSKTLSLNISKSQLEASLNILEHQRNKLYD